MDITPLTYTHPGKITATFDLESAVYNARHSKSSLAKLRALATLLDIEIPKGMHTYRRTGEWSLYDADGNELTYGLDDTYQCAELYNAAQMKAEYIQELIERRVKTLGN